jgi:L-malate glycosyltransferase
MALSIKTWKYNKLVSKRKVESFLMCPLVFLGAIIALFKPLKLEYDIFFFFPFYHIGGAEKVHYQICEAAKNTKCIVFFTKKSNGANFKTAFEDTGVTIKEVSNYTDNKWLYFTNIIFRGIISTYINQQKNSPIVFNGQCNFGYKISPWLNKRIKQVELIHAFNSFSWIRLPFLEFYSTTVMISQVKIKEHLEQYKLLNVPQIYTGNIVYINNAIKINKEEISKETDKFIVLFVGRNSPEKRVELCTLIARSFLENNNIEFHFLGIKKEEIVAHENCKFWGEVTDPILIQTIYKSAQCLLLTSNTEGFPMVVIEAMANKCAIVTTAVGDIPIHVKNYENGFIIGNYIDNENVVKESIEHINFLLQNKPVLRNMQQNSKLYAGKTFGIDSFNESYKKILSH